MLCILVGLLGIACWGAPFKYLRARFSREVDVVRLQAGMATVNGVV